MFLQEKLWLLWMRAHCGFLHWITQTLPNQKSGCGGKWVIDSCEPGGENWPSTGIRRLQRHIVYCVIARGRGGKGHDSKDISQCDLQLKSEHEIWTRCSVRRQWVGNWLFYRAWYVETEAQRILRWVEVFEDFEELSRGYFKFSSFSLKYQKGSLTEWWKE